VGADLQCALGAAQDGVPGVQSDVPVYETWPGNSNALRVWRTSLVFSGVLVAAIIALIAVMTLPVVRRKHFNLFYYTHLLIIPGVIIICLHASTVFYYAAPGLFMWVLDWGMRLYELRRKLDGKVAAVGNGWYWYKSHDL
jgi:hypothetical protein